MNIRSTFVCVTALGLALVGTVLAAHEVRALSSSSAQGPSQPLSPRTSDRQVQQTLTRLRTDAESLRQIVDADASRGRAYGNRARQDRNEVSYLVDDLLQATDHFNDHVLRREVIQADLDDLLRRAVLIDRSLGGAPVPNSQPAWTRVARDLDDLAAGYGMSQGWRERRDAPVLSPGGAYVRLTGTYELDPSRSDNPRELADRALGQVSAAERARISNQVYARIEAPNVLSIDRNGTQVTIASSRAPQMTFDADGRPHAEQMYGGQMVTTRANVYGDRLEVNSTGGRGTDYSATFEPLDGGRSIQLSRQIYDEALRQPIVVHSVYRRTSDIAEWNVYDARANAAPAPPYPAIVPDGTILVATLDQDVSTRAARQNDRVTLTVRNAHSEFEGATIQGYLVTAPTQRNGRTGVSVEFNEIRLRNGQTGRFEGRVQSVRGTAGHELVFEADPNQAPDAQRDEAVQHGAIGATVGAIIGAIAGGGKGAAIGAVIGGGAGVATVYMNVDESSLVRGTEFTIRARTFTERP